MSNIIIGTAGHIDHGKTSLIRGLTGSNTDRLKEEQDRGISIDIGFSNLELPSGIKAGIVDVPGHEKFVKNMLAGIHGIDIALLVIAADEGIMLQTKEHLEILELLDIKSSIIVLTKIDLVDAEWLDMMEEELRESFKNTLFEKSSIIRVSNSDNIGYNDLINEIDTLAQITGEKNKEISPILPIDRSFTIQGHGTVITGTLISGELSVGDDIEIYPEGIRSKIRSIQVHDNSVDNCYAGQRVAINLSNVNKENVGRGNILAIPDSFLKTDIIDVKLKLLDGLEKSIKNRTRVRIYMGTREVLGRVIFLDRDLLDPGEEAYCQILLEEEIVAKYNDKFILRFYSPVSNLGGGVILNPNAVRGKRFKEGDLIKISKLDSDNINEVILHIIETSLDKFLSINYLRRYFNIKEETLRHELEYLKSKDLIKQFSLLNTDYYINISKYDTLNNLIYEELKEYHFKYPLKIGKNKEEIRNKYFSGINIKLFEQYLDFMIKDKIIKQNKEYLSIIDHEVKLSGEEKELGDIIIKVAEKNNYMLPKLSEIIDEVDIESSKFYNILDVLKSNGSIISIDDDYIITSKQYDSILVIIKRYLSENDGIEIADFRDLIDSNRKISISILEYLDKVRVTKRKENIRILY